MEKFEWERVNKEQYDTTDRMHVGNGYIYKVKSRSLGDSSISLVFVPDSPTRKKK